MPPFPCVAFQPGLPGPNSLKVGSEKLIRGCQSGCLFGNLEFITDTPDSLQIPLVADTFQFLAKALDVYVNSSGIAEIVKPPYLVQQLISRKNTVR